jgi:hypothetical protein
VVKRVEFLVIDCGIVLSDCWCVVVLSVYEPSVERMDYLQEVFCKDL